MKTLLKCCFAVSLFLFVFAYAAKAQEKIKFGEVSAEDLNMSVYPEDTSAVAVVLHESCRVWYDVATDDFVLKTSHTVRIKILKTSGLSYADVNLPFYVTSGSRKSERIYGISGFTHNIADGKIQRTKLLKDYIFEEKTSENMRRMKIAFQNVQAGSVIELKYEKSSPYYSYIDDYIFQSSIPVIYSTYTAIIPEYFSFGKRTAGYEYIDFSEKQVNVSFMINGQRLSCSGSEMTFTAKNLPVLKDDNYVWNKNDFTSKIMFDLRSFQIVGVTYKNFSVTWQDIDKQLMEDERFGKQFRFSNLMKEEMAKAIDVSMTPEQKINAVLNLVKAKVQWDERNVLYIDNVRKALKEGKGSSAEMNALLICLLRDAGFEAYPVVMSLRSRGRIFSAFPTQKSLNYFLTGVDIDGKSVYMDASDKYGAVNVIPMNCMVQEARCVLDEGKPSRWVDLHDIGRNGTLKNITAKFNEEGKLSGTVSETYSGIPYVRYCTLTDKQKSADDYRETLETKLNISISDLEQGKPQGASVSEKYSFENNNIVLGDDYIYLDALIFPYIDENPFKAESRKLPVEFPYPYDYVMTTTIELPEGYEVEEIPVAERITLGDRQINFNFAARQQDRILQVTQRITLRETVYPVQQYEHVRDFWAHIADKNTAQLVLKRIEQ